jgi:hypothetical protein
VAAGARCRPVCPPPRALEMSPRSTEGWSAVPSHRPARTSQSHSAACPLSSLFVQCQLLAARSRILFASAHALPHGQKARPAVQNTVMPGFSGPKTSQPSLERSARRLSSPSAHRWHCTGCREVVAQHATARPASARPPCAALATACGSTGEPRTGSHLRPSPPVAPALRLRSAALPGAPLPHHTTQRLRRRLEFRRGRVREKQVYSTDETTRLNMGFS